MRYCFDGFVLDTDNFRLSEDSVEIAAEPMVFDLLHFLIERAGTVVTRDAILARVWKGRVVSDAAVASSVKAARRCLGDSGARQRFIRTVHGRGFEFIGQVALDPEMARHRSSSITNNNARQIESGKASARTDDSIATFGPPPSIAVLPFVPLPHSPGLEVIGDALAQELILELSRLHWLFVIARGSSFQFRGCDVEVARAGEILGARYVLCGTLMVSGNNCDVAVELNHAADKQVVWAQRFSMKTGELMHLRTLLASEIVAVMETRIQFAEVLQASRVATEHLDAWAAYHRGLWHMYRFHARDNDTAGQLFNLALERDPNFARAHAGLSFTHFQNAFLGFSADAERERHLAQHHAETAYQKDPLDPFVNLTMGRHEWLGGDIESATQWLDRSIALNPNYAFALYNRGLVGTFLGDGEGSEASVAKAIELSPIDPLNYAMLATRALSHIVRGNYAAAAQWGQRASRQPSAHIHIYAIAAIANVLAGNQHQAEEHVVRARRDQPHYGADDFFRYFHFRDPSVRQSIVRAWEGVRL